MGRKMMRLVAALVAALQAACLSPPSEATDATGGEDASGPSGRAWSERFPETNPGALHYPKLVYDSERREVLLFGGTTTAGQEGAVSTLWAWDGETWSNRCESCAPAPRIGHGFAFDPERKVAVLFGGTDQNGNYLGDLWEWDGSSWSTPGAVGDVPPPRSGVWMGYHPARERIVLFGGETGTGDYSDRVYEYDGTEWTSPEVTGTWPTERMDGGAAMAYDPQRKQLLLYSGYMPAATDDLWGWGDSDSGWERRCGPCLGEERASAALGFDAARDRVLIINGYDDGELAGTVELAGSEVACRQPQPSARDTGGIALDKDRDAFVYYGGNGCDGGNCDDTLELEPDELASCEP